MILGAGKNEVPAVMAANKRGIETIVVDMDPAAPALKLASKAIIASTRDADEYVEIARREGIDGAMTVSCESLVRKLAEITNALGLPGISRQTALIATDKSAMRKVFHEKGIPSPKFIDAKELDEAKKKAGSLRWPLVIKPVDRAGSRGVVKLNDEDELVKYFETVKNISICGKVIIEEYIEGADSTIDAITIDGRTHILGISDKMKMHSPNIIAMDLTFPPAYSGEKVRQVEELVKKMLKAVGLERGSSHTEVFVTDEGPMVIEFGARSGGALIPSDILPHLCGMDVMDKLISLALGEDPGIKNVALSNAADLRFFNSPLGRLKRIIGIEEASKIKGVHKLDFIVEEGSLIKPLTEGKDRIGYVITYGKDREEAVSIADTVQGLIKFEMY